MNSSSYLQGVWYNELGSTANISVDENGVITGKYVTIVTRPPQPPKGLEAPIHGLLTKSSNEPFVFSVLWPDSYPSTTTWTGQYFIVNDKEVLRTTWVLRSKSTADWNATLIGENVFTRDPPSLAQTAVARHADKDGSPLHHDLIFDAMANRMLQSKGEAGGLSSPSLIGDWYSEFNARLHITTCDSQTNVTTGQYTNVDGATMDIFGVATCREDAINPTFGLYGITSKQYNEIISIGWVGQLKLDAKGTEYLSISWLSKAPVSSQKEIWKSTLFGDDVFHRTKNQE